MLNPEPSLLAAAGTLTPANREQPPLLEIVRRQNHPWTVPDRMDEFEPRHAAVVTQTCVVTGSRSLYDNVTSDGRVLLNDQELAP
jgi:hypothetical protein